jgi:HMG (high mobility group) box
VSRSAQLVTSIRSAAQALRDRANKTDDFANYLQNVFPVPQPYPGVALALSLQSGPASGLVADGAPVKRKPGRPKKTDQDEDGAAADDGAVNGDGKKRKRQVKEKKPKDPNAPKRPPSAYLLYQNQVRKDVQAANPGIPYTEILGHISKAWAQLSEEEKTVCDSVRLDARWTRF